MLYFVYVNKTCVHGAMVKKYKMQRKGNRETQEQPREEISQNSQPRCWLLLCRAVHLPYTCVVYVYNTHAHDAQYILRRAIALC